MDVPSSRSLEHRRQTASFVAVLTEVAITGEISDLVGYPSYETLLSTENSELLMCFTNVDELHL